MAKPKIEVRGLKEAVRALHEADARALKAADAAIRDELDAIRDDMRRAVPVDSGDLKRSIVTRPGRLKGEVAATERYAGFVEHGTKSSPAHPFATPAADVARKRAPKRVRDAVLKALQGVKK